MSRARPERLIGILVVLVLLAAAVLVVALLSGPPPSAVPGPSGGMPAGVPAVVEHVTDGDTITVLVDGVRERVRYIGLDAPEIANDEDGTAAECGGDEARSANADLAAGAEVVLEQDVSDRDRFGRLLRHVWLQTAGTWQVIGERLVEIGAVEARSYPPDTARDAILDAAERRARDAGLGIWGSC